MEPLFSPLMSAPAAAALPTAFPSPFDAAGPHPVARLAAARLQRALQDRGLLSDAELAALRLPGGGTMFGVLVARAPDGTLGYLRAFAGRLGGRWEVPGFVPPVFDALAREAIETPGEAVVRELVARAAAHAASPHLASARAEAQALAARHVAARAELRRRHAERKAARHGARALLAPDAAVDLRALDQESRGDKAERRRLEAALDAEAAQARRRLARLERRGLALERLRQSVCRALERRIHEAYLVRCAAGESRPLAALYVRGAPPSGAADCAAPKLLAAAYRLGVQPLALAEFWWGAPPDTGGRVEGAFYPACKEKCGPLLPFMLRGLDVTAAQVFTPAPVTAELRILFEDRWLVVVDKPDGLLSVPGKGAQLRDSVLTRLRALHPALLLVHRLDLDTSGLLVAAKDADVYRALQRQFTQREVEKRYLAVLSGEVVGEGGEVELPLRVDLHDRPRQIVDPVHGLAARTTWRVLARSGGRTRVALFPSTGRTHQLRVHCAHPRGLGVPIVGDRLYGHPGPRLLLHAEALGFVHPRTGARLDLVSPAPF